MWGAGGNENVRGGQHLEEELLLHCLLPMPLMDPLGTGAAEAAPSTGRGYWQKQPPAQGGVIAGDVVLPWPRHPRAAVAAAGADPAAGGTQGHSSLERLSSGTGVLEEMPGLQKLLCLWYLPVWGSLG